MVRRSFFVFAVFSSLWWSSSAATVVVTGASKLDLPANVLPEDGAVLTGKVSVDGFVQCGGKVYQSGGQHQTFCFCRVRPSLWRLHSFSCSGQEVLLASQKPKVLLGICKCLWPPASLLQLLLTPSQRTAIRLTRGLPGRRKIHWLRLFQKLMQAFGKVDIALADLSRVQPFFSLTTQKQGQRSKKKRQGRSLSTDRIFSSWKFHWRGTMSSLGIRRLVFQFNWRVFWFSLQMQYCVVLFQNNGLDGISFPWILPTIRRTLFWILVAHDQLGQERRSDGSKNMRCILVLRPEFYPCKKSFVFANSEAETRRPDETWNFCSVATNISISSSCHRTTVSAEEDEDDKPLVQPASTEKSAEAWIFCSTQSVSGVT